MNRGARAFRPALLAVALLGCAGGPDLAGDDATLRACLDGYRMIDQAVLEAGVRDAEAHPVDGLPHLRASRFLASFAARDLTDEGYRAWLGRMAALDREARQIELVNLPPDDRTRLAGRLSGLAPAWRETAALFAVCSGPLLEATGAMPRHRLQAAVSVPDEYSRLARMLGVYPLTAVPVALGYQRWRANNLPAFDRPVATRGLGDTMLYRPRVAGPPVVPHQARTIVADAAARDPLAVPDLTRDELTALAEAFAPTLLVAQASGADRVGHPVWRTDGLPEVDPERPVAFVRLAHAWFRGRPIAQLVYLFWFDERPAEGPVDLLAGRLDGLIWRVSLDKRGRPIVYDTIHACGCYHLFFPAPGTSVRDVPENRPGDPRDPIVVPAHADTLGPADRPLLRIAAGSHYVTGLGELTALAPPPREIMDYDLVIDQPADRALRSMPAPTGGRRSLYGPDGIVAGTERAERVLLWPTGVLEPGAMRQWGRHATAFVGERHFDDPFLIDRAFAR